VIEWTWQRWPLEEQSDVPALIGDIGRYQVNVGPPAQRRADASYGFAAVILVPACAGSPATRRIAL
jgi:hypothetical protein